MNTYVFACYKCGEDLKAEVENKTQFKDKTFYEGEASTDSRRMLPFDKKEVTCTKCDLEMVLELDSMPTYYLSAEVKNERDI